MQTLTKAISITSKAQRFLFIYESKVPKVDIWMLKIVLRISLWAGVNIPKNSSMESWKRARDTETDHAMIQRRTIKTMNNFDIENLNDCVPGGLAAASAPQRRPCRAKPHQEPERASSAAERPAKRAGRWAQLPGLRQEMCLGSRPRRSARPPTNALDTDSTRTLDHVRKRTVFHNHHWSDITES